MGAVGVLGMLGAAGAAGAAPLAPPALTTHIEVENAMVGANEDVNVRFTLRNDSTEDLSLVYWQTPLRGVVSDLFDIRDTNGGRVAYIGREYKWATPTDSDFVRIPAGGELSTTVELSSVYDIARSGDYTVRFRVSPREALLVRAAGASAAVDRSGMISNAVSLFIERDEVTREQQMANAVADAAAQIVAPRYLTPGYVSCSSSRQTTLKSALGAAETMANKAKAYLATGAADSGYTTWFGAYTASRYSTVKTHFNNITGVFSGKTVTFYCDCTDSAYAYVYPNQPYKIHLCNAFWSAGLTGIDSKGGTLVHETSHFTVVASTDDWAYGTAACKSLASSNPTKAIDNADCHEYFAETK